MSPPSFQLIDSNLEANNTEQSMMTSGFNLIIMGSDLGKLNLMVAHPEASNNVELINSTIESLYLTPSSPPVYRFDQVRVE